MLTETDTNGCVTVPFVGFSEHFPVSVQVTSTCLETDIFFFCIPIDFRNAVKDTDTNQIRLKALKA